MRRRPWRLPGLLLLAIACMPVLHAHEVRPGFLELVETAPGAFDVTWKVPARGDRVLAMEPLLPAVCVRVAPPTYSDAPGSQITRWSVTCGEAGLHGRSIEIGGLRTLQVDVLVRIEPLQGERLSAIVRPADPVFRVDEGAAAGPVWGYLVLGIEHILLGVDHLLFVLGLMFIVTGTRRLVATITAFTIAHSITLGIATLGYASAPVDPMNAMIALSILFLGPEIVRAYRGGTSLTLRYPWLIAFAFGLLHGFGFASGLSSIGLPRDEIPLVLLLFNVGVEVGQLAFVFLVLAMGHAFRVLALELPRHAGLAPAYLVGSLGAYWTIQRTAALVGIAL